MRPLKLQTSRIGMLAVLEDCLRAGGSHLHLKVPGRPQFRIQGRLHPTAHDRLTPEDLQSAVSTLVELAREERLPANQTDVRLSFGVEGLGSFRAQLVRQRGTWGVVVQVVAVEPPTIGALGLPPEVVTVVEEARGLVLVGGGRMRSAVLASLIRQYNQSCYGHLVTIEDPVDFLHADHRASITQREVGHDLPDIRTGLLSAIRQDPDALVVSEVPDAFEGEGILRMAEEGLFVVAGLTTAQGQDTLAAFVRRFPPSRQAEVAPRLAGLLAGVIAVAGDGKASWLPATDQLVAALRAGRLVAADTGP